VFFWSADFETALRWRWRVHRIVKPEKREVRPGSSVSYSILDKSTRGLDFQFEEKREQKNIFFNGIVEKMRVKTRKS
jgi:hypothetical protein